MITTKTQARRSILHINLGDITQFFRRGISAMPPELTDASVRYIFVDSSDYWSACQGYDPIDAINRYAYHAKKQQKKVVFYGLDSVVLDIFDKTGTGKGLLARGMGYTSSEFEEAMQEFAKCP